jgi:carboxyl-terminal processing protease
MNPKLRIFAWFPVLIALLACSNYIPILRPEPTLSLAQKNYSGKASSTPLPTTTPSPTATVTPSPLPPSSTPTPVSTATLTPTDIPLNTQLSIFDDLWMIVNDTYIYPDFNGLDWNAVYKEYRQIISDGLTNEQFYLAMSDLIASLGDDHSFFIDPQQVAEQEAEYQGEYEYVGIGVMVSAIPERDRAVIISVFPGSPAKAAGLQPRDSILSVDGAPILDEYGYLRDIVRGPEGSTINITVQSPGEDPRIIQITRHRISGEAPVIYEVITTPEGKRIGYILLVTFEDSTVDEQVAEALWQMNADAPLDGLILDNRMNGGGSSTVLEPMLGFFAGGDLGTFFSRDQEHPLQIRLNNINGSSQVPLVVLIGKGTASFGEIFAGVLQDIDRAYLIGTTTDGNVEILWGYELEDGSKVWLANETFRPLNHPEQDWEKNGIIPDLNISGDFDEFSLNNDPAVAAAIQYLSER